MFATTLIHVGVLDIASTVMLAMVIVLIGLVDLQVFASLAVLRQISLVIRLRSATRPVSNWQRAGFDPHMLVAANAAVDSMLARVITAAVIGWAAMLSAVILLPWLGVQTSRAIGGPELLFSTLLTIAVMMAMVPLLGQVLERALLDVRIELGRARLEQQLASAPTSMSLAWQLVVINVGTATAIVIGLSATTMYERANRLRVETLAEQRESVALVATHLREGLREPDSVAALGLELVGVEQLPEQLGVETSSPPGPSETVSTVDVRRELAIAAAPVGDGRWVVARVEVEQQLGWVIFLVGVFVGGCVFVGVFTGMALHRVLTTPLAQLDEATRRMAEHGDIGKIGRITPLRNDELGALANNFNRMLDTLDELTTAAAAVAKGDLRVDIHGAGDLPDALRGMLARLNEVVEQIRSTSLELASAAAEIHTIIGEQERATEQQSERVLAVSGTIATLAESAEDISTISTEVLDNAEHALSTTDAMIEKINLLSARAGSVRALLELIREVADRSDLLALNGALEATRAGDAGRGFALVASEMRRLAERVTGTVGDVRERIADIEAAGASTVHATADSRRLADSTASAARKISTVTHRQSEETEQVSRKVFEVAEGMIATVEAAKQTLAATEGLRMQAAELERLTRQFTLRDTGTAATPIHPGGRALARSGSSPVDRGSLVGRS